MEKLLELLGQDLYKQVADKLGENYVLIDKPNFVKKERFDEVSNQLKDYKTQLAERDTQLKELGDKAKGNEELTKKIGELETANKTQKETYEKQISAREREYSIDSELGKVGVKNSKAVKALLDNDKIVLKDGSISGLNEQIEALKKSDAYLFKETQPTPPAKGGNEITPPAGGSNNQYVDLLKL
jgi:septal ring factor EnvC (AmiA/AmiB activator)